VNCDWKIDEPKQGRAVVKCARVGCTNRLYAESPAGCIARCRAIDDPRSVRIVSSGLGDRVAKLFAAVGITEARWLALKGVVIVQPSCRCQKRRETLNRWGRWLESWRHEVE
jgi:hypothetical protein